MKYCQKKKAKYICKTCVDKIEDKSQRCSLVESSECDFNSISEDEAYDSSIQMAEHLIPYIKSDIAALYSDKEKCSLSNLLGYSRDDWLNQRPKLLIGLLRHLYDYSETMNNEESKRLAKCMEQIYGCHNSKLILPLSFQENLLVYSLCRSKQLVTYNCKMYPSGSPDFISKWLTGQSNVPVQFPEGLVSSVFDNEQVIGKTHKVKSDNKVPSSVITSHIYISIDSKNKLQNDVKFAPTNWLFSDNTEEDKEAFADLSAPYSSLFRETRNNFIDGRLKSVYDEHKGQQHDFIDDLLKIKAPQA